MLLVLLLSLAPALPAASLLGPGRGAWARGQPEAHNLTAAALELAGRQLQLEAPVKECFAVAKGGELLYELDYRAAAGEPAPLIESDSAGKTITALLIGVLVTKYDLSLDSTLESHGVRPQADWGPGNTFYPNVTIRHVLGQVAGSGKYPPGVAFTYDSGDYLQHLTALIRAVSKQPPKAFATEHFAVPLGIPKLYTNDSYTSIDPAADDNITAGGSQFVDCVMMLRFGQLIVNRGVWPDADGRPQQLIDAGYIEQMLTPQFPEAAQNYGLLTWLATAGPPAGTGGKITGCCQPQWYCLNPEHVDGGGDVSAAEGGRWGALLPGETILSEAPLQAAGLPRPRPGLGLALGWLDKHMIVDPRSNTTIVAFGQTLGASKGCGERFRPGDGSSKGSWEAGADGAFSASLVWKVVHPLLPSESYELSGSGSGSAQGSGSGSAEPSVHKSRGGLRPTAPAALARPDGLGSRRAKRLAAMAAAAHSPAANRSSAGGSCVCYCGPQQGFGGCAPVASAAECSTAKVRPQGVCPAIGMVMQCVSEAEGNTSKGGCDSRPSEEGGLGNCTAFGEQDCGSGTGSPFDAMRCSCVPTAFEWCGYMPAACPKDDPFFPAIRPEPALGSARLSSGALGSGSDEAPCRTDEDCSLLGTCADGECRCNDGWAGSRCSELDLAPAVRTTPGYYNTSMPTWYGSIIEERGQYYMFAVARAVAQGAPYDDYFTNSRLVRLVSDSGSAEGPYSMAEVVLPRFAHEARALRAPDSTVLIFGVTAPGPSVPFIPTTGCALLRNASFPWAHLALTLSWAPSALGPWSHKTLWHFHEREASDPYCRTEAPVATFAPNGSVLMVRRPAAASHLLCTQVACLECAQVFNAFPCAPTPWHPSVDQLYIATAPHWSGAFTRRTDIGPIVRRPGYSSGTEGAEDPCAPQLTCSDRIGAADC